VDSSGRWPSNSAGNGWVIQSNRRISTASWKGTEYLNSWAPLRLAVDEAQCSILQDFTRRQLRLCEAYRRQQPVQSLDDAGGCQSGLWCCNHYGLSLDEPVQRDSYRESLPPIRKAEAECDSSERKRRTVTLRLGNFTVRQCATALELLRCDRSAWMRIECVAIGLLGCGSKAC